VIERAAVGCGGPADDDDDGNCKIGEAGKNPWRARGWGGTHVSYVRASELLGRSSRIKNVL
jgi:hypothetical protein